MLKNNGHEFEFKRLNPQVLKADPLYQRPIMQARVNKIVREWNDDLVNEPKVSQRENGDYYVFNGDHTVMAHIQKKGKSVPILCKVFRGLTWQEEKDLFVAQNGISKDPTTNEKLRAEYNGGNENVVNMVNAASVAGVRIDFTKGGAKGKIVAVSAAYEAFMAIGYDQFVMAMKLLNDAFEGDKDAFTAGFIKGIANVFKKYGKTISQTALKNALKKHSPAYFIRAAADMNGRLDIRFEKLFLKEYNFKRTTGRIFEE